MWGVLAGSSTSWRWTGFWAKMELVLLVDLILFPSPPPPTHTHCIACFLLKCHHSDSLHVHTCHGEEVFIYCFYTHACMHAHTHTRMQTVLFLHTCTHACMYTHTHACACMHAHTCTCTHTHTHTPETTTKKPHTHTQPQQPKNIQHWQELLMHAKQSFWAGVVLSWVLVAILKPWQKHYIDIRTIF